LCEECSTSHEVSLLRHAPIAASPIESQAEAAIPPIRHLALAIVDAVTDQKHGSAAPSFSSRSVAV
jgi:hypothetical protein